MRSHAIVVAMGVTGALVAPVNAGAARATSSSTSCTIIGTAGDDTLIGTDGPDVICALAGNDTITGLGGDDLIYGGPGNDTIDAGDGNDRAFGLAGDDTINGGPGNDQLGGGAGNDRIDGQEGNDTAWGASGRDIIFGRDGDDRLWGGPGDDIIGGFLGDDIIGGGAGFDTLNGDEGNDIIYFGTDGGIATGDDGDDVIVGPTSVDLTPGNDNGVDIEGGPGNDTIYGLNGGPGTERTRSFASPTFTNNLQGGPGDDVIYGTNFNDYLEGEILIGRDGDDQLALTTENRPVFPRAFGGPGNDTIFGTLRPDTLYGGPGDDFITGQAGADRIDGGTGADQLYGNGQGIALDDPLDERDIIRAGNDTDIDTIATEAADRCIAGPEDIILTGPYAPGVTCGSASVGGDSGGDMDTSSDPNPAPVVVSCRAFSTERGIGLEWVVENPERVSAFTYQYSWTEPATFISQNGVGSLPPDSFERNGDTWSGGIGLGLGDILTFARITAETLDGERSEAVCENEGAVSGGIPGGPSCSTFVPNVVSIDGAPYPVSGYELESTLPDGSTELLRTATSGPFTPPGPRSSTVSVSVRAVLPDGTLSLTNDCGEVEIPQFPDEFVVSRCATVGLASLIRVEWDANVPPSLLGTRFVTDYTARLPDGSVVSGQLTEFSTNRRVFIRDLPLGTVVTSQLSVRTLDGSEPPIEPVDCGPVIVGGAGLSPECTVEGLVVTFDDDSPQFDSYQVALSQSGDLPAFLNIGIPNSPFTINTFDRELAGTFDVFVHGAYADQPGVAAGSFCGTTTLLPPE